MSWEDERMNAMTKKLADDLDTHILEAWTPANPNAVIVNVPPRPNLPNLWTEVKPNVYEARVEDIEALKLEGKLIKSIEGNLLVPAPAVFATTYFTGDDFTYKGVKDNFEWWLFVQATSPIFMAVLKKSVNLSANFFKNCTARIKKTETKLMITSTPSSENDNFFKEWLMDYTNNKPIPAALWKVPYIDPVEIMKPNVS